MKNTTRDNIIYLSVALAVVVGLVITTIYFLRGAKIWVPSQVGFRAFYTTALLVYFIVREARKLKATVAQLVGCALLASILHLILVFVFRQPIDQLPGIDFMVVVVVEVFIFVKLLPFAIRHTHVRPNKAGRRGHA